MGETPIRYQSILADSARWEGFPFREGDIVISTPSKCGTTWIQMICALLVFQAPNFDRPLAEISPWFDMLTTDRNELVAALEAQPHRRFIKTHTPLDGLPLDDQVTYICVGRDPRDAGFSWCNHRANLDTNAFLAARRKAVGLDDLDELLPNGPPVLPPTEIERFWCWVGDTRPAAEWPAGLAALLHHVRTFWPATAGTPHLVLLHYDDLQADLEGQMRYLARRLGIDVPEERWPELVPAARFDEMRRRADDLVPNRCEALWHDNAEFFHRGTSGQWRTRLTEDDLRRYHLRVAELGDPEVAGWLIFVDTSFWFALRRRRDPNHELARNLLEKHGGQPLLTSNHVRGETCTLINRREGHRAAVAFLDVLSRSPRLHIEHVTAQLELQALSWLRQRDDREFSFVDATSFAVMRRRSVHDALAFDGDFAAAGFVELR